MEKFCFRCIINEKWHGSRRFIHWSSWFLWRKWRTKAQNYSTSSKSWVEEWTTVNGSLCYNNENAGTKKSSVGGLSLHREQGDWLKTYFDSVFLFNKIFGPGLLLWTSSMNVIKTDCIPNNVTYLVSICLLLTPLHEHMSTPKPAQGAPLMGVYGHLYQALLRKKTVPFD